MRRPAGTIAHLRTADASTFTEIKELLKQLSASGIPIKFPAFKKLLANPNLEVWVVQDGSRIVGMGTLIEYQILSGRSAEIEDVVIDKEYRGKGFGRSLMKKLIARAKARGCDEASLTSRPSRIAANHLYKKLGLKIRKTNVYHMAL